MIERVIDQNLCDQNRKLLLDVEAQVRGIVGTLSEQRDDDADKAESVDRKGKNLVVMHLFHADLFRGNLCRDCDEGTLEWLPKTELRKKELWSGDHIFLDLMESGAPFFSLKLCYRGETLTAAVLNGGDLKIHGT